MSETVEKKIKNEEDSKIINWVLTFFIPFALGVFILRQILGFWLSKETTFIISLFAYSAFYFFIPIQNSWFKEKFGSGLKGFIVFTISLGIISTCSYLLLKFLLKSVFSIFRFHLPTEIGIGIILGSFFIFAALMFYWLTKSTNK